MTPFTEIYDLALIDIKDYRIDKLFESDYNSFLMYMEGILIRAKYNFEANCLHSLDYEDIDNEKYFKEELSGSEKLILADTMILNWMEQVVNDITQVNLHLQGRDKKTKQNRSRSL